MAYDPTHGDIPPPPDMDDAMMAYGNDAPPPPPEESERGAGWDAPMDPPPPPPDSDLEDLGFGVPPPPESLLSGLVFDEPDSPSNIIRDPQTQSLKAGSFAKIIERLTHPTAVGSSCVLSPLLYPSTSLLLFAAPLAALAPSASLRHSSCFSHSSTRTDLHCTFPCFYRLELLV